MKAYMAVVIVALMLSVLVIQSDAFDLGAFNPCKHLPGM